MRRKRWQNWRPRDAIERGELAADIEPLVRFLSVFVSAETADSQQIVNWPANVRAGVDALDSYAAGTC